MKKYATSLVMLLVMQNMWTMENQVATFSPKQEKKCLLVARYLNKYPAGKNEEEENKIKSFFNDRTNLVVCVRTHMLSIDEDMDKAVSFVKSIPDKLFSELHTHFSQLTEGVKREIEFKKFSRPYLLMTFHCQDIFEHLFHNCLPKTYSDTTGFFTTGSHGKIPIESSQKGAMLPQDDGDNILHTVDHEKIKGELLKMPNTVDHEKIKGELLKMPIIKALSVFYFMDQNYEFGYSMNTREKKLPEQGGFSSCSSLLERTIEKTYKCKLTYEDVCRLNEEELVLVGEKLHIAEKYNDGGTRIHGHKALSEQDLVILKRIREEPLLRNEYFKKLITQVKLSPSSLWEKGRDKLLLGVSLLVGTCLSDYVRRQMQIDGIKGLLLCGAGGFAFGDYVYPTIDSYHSSVAKLSRVFGENNQARMKSRGTFLVLTVLHYILTAIADQFLSVVSVPCEVFGKALYTARAYLLLRGLFDIEKKKPCERRTLLECLKWEEYEIPYGKRRNKNNEKFTLEDLLNGPIISARK